MSYERLKRCPFCGGNARTEVCVMKMGGTEDLVDFSVHCTGCGIEKKVRLKIRRGGCVFGEVYQAIDQVVAAWNQREGDQDE